MRKTNFIKKCECCSNEFKAYKPKANQVFRFCSQECYHKKRRVFPSLACQRCGKEFFRHKKLQRFCSKKCFFPGPDIDIVKKLYLEDFLSLKKVSEKVGCCAQTLSKIMKINSIPLRIELRASFDGGKPFNYVDGSSKTERVLETNMKKLRHWRKRVFERDNYTCVKCGARGKLNADHIVRFVDDKSLRYEISNGQTLCISCHREKTATEGRKYWVNQFSSSLNKSTTRS